MNSLENKIAVVTGGNSGIGYHTAKVLKRQGATVIITGRRKDALERAAIELGVIPMLADQSSIAAIESLTTQITADFGRVDILFINAGIIGMSSIEEATETLFDDIMSINFKGSYFILSKFIPLLSSGASVIFLSSNTATKTSSGASVYSASKAALNSLMKTAALELAPRKIRVNSVSPGPTETEILNKLGLDETTLQNVKTSVIDRVPLRRFGLAEHVGEMVAFLSSDKADFTTGAEIIIDGGMVLA